MSKLFTMKDGFKQNSLLEQHIDTEGNIVMISGKVVSQIALLVLHQKMWSLLSLLSLLRL